MTATLHEVIAATSFLRWCQPVEVLSLTVDLDAIVFSQGAPVDVTTVRLHVYRWSEAAQLAHALCLPEVDSYQIESTPGDWWSYRRWTGWLDDAPLTASLDVVAGERCEGPAEAAEPVAASADSGAV